MKVKKVARLVVSSLMVTGFLTGAAVLAGPGVDTASAQEAVEAGTVTGKILETMNAGGYTYVFVENSLGKQWVALPESEVKVGDEITYMQGMTMTDFYSKTLDRTFEAIIFSGGIAGAKMMPGANAKKEPVSEASNSFAAAVAEEKGTASAPALEDNPNGSAGAVAPMMELNIEKAGGDNGYTVNEIYEKAKELDTKTVQVRGRVVKVNMNIMGRHWVHIQDGTGNPMKNSHDLVVTTDKVIEEDSVITVEGVVAAEKDFGAGYKYVVLLEEGREVGK